MGRPLVKGGVLKKMTHEAFVEGIDKLDPNDLDGMIDFAMRNDIIIRVAARENGIRRSLADRLEAARVAKNMSLKELRNQMKVSQSQVAMVLHKEVGGRLYLSTILKACDVLEVPFLISGNG